MKKTIITLLCVVATYSVFAQTTVTSKALGDLITIQKGAFEITPIVVTLKGDTARSMSWYATSVSRDTTVAFYLTYTTYDKSGGQLATDSQYIPASIYSKWAGFLNRIDNYILNLRRRLIKQ